MAMPSKRRGPGLFILLLALALAVLRFARPTWRMFVPFQAYARNGGKIARQQIAKEVVPTIPIALPPKEVERIHAAVRTKALEAIALGNLPPGKELELISALDLGTIPWTQFPVQLKEQLALPLEDRGIDSLSLNLSVAVQAKDYANGSTVPLSSLATFHLLVEGKCSKLKGLVQQMIVATSDGTLLPKLWQLTGAVQRTYSPKKIQSYRRIAQEASLAREKTFTTPVRKLLKRWPHQKECLKHCRKFLQNRSKIAKKDFFVQMATGTGKSLVMTDLLAEISPSQKACIIVPKLDLMEQMAQLLEELHPSSHICRVGTGWPANLTADVFVCVRNSAWQLANLTFHVILLDEGHHYEPLAMMADASATDREAAETNGSTADDLGAAVMTHTLQVLALKTKKRIFFSATLRRNSADFDFGLRPAIEAGVIEDYSVMVPVLSEGDPRPGLVELIRNLPLSRKILAFCNTVHEAQRFTQMLTEAGIAADHYNGGTSSKLRGDILKSFQRPESYGGIRVLVTVDVLSEGVDLPVADTCLFVAPRWGLRLRQCVGRVLRKHHTKVDALVIAPPIVKRPNGSLTEEAELTRLLSQLATADPWFEQALQSGDTDQSRLSISTSGMMADDQEHVLGEKAARFIRIHVLPYVLDTCCACSYWDRAYQELVAYKVEHGHVLVSKKYCALSGLKLGRWVSTQRQAKRSKTLSCDQFERLADLGFVWDVRKFRWEASMRRLAAYTAKHGHALVPKEFNCSDGFRLGSWVKTQRAARAKGKLDKEQILQLKEHGFIWDANYCAWNAAAERLETYKAEHGNALVPWLYMCADGFRLGMWVSKQRAARAKGRLDKEQILRLDKHKFVWDTDQATWNAAVERLNAYKAEHGNALVPQVYKGADGFWLGMWVSKQRAARAKGKLDKEQILQLNEHGFIWDANYCAWKAAAERLETYKAEHGNAVVPWFYKCADGFRLGRWVGTQRLARAKGKLDKEQILKLDACGFIWDANYCAWNAAAERLETYKAEHGNALVPWLYKCADGFRLGMWVSKQRAARAKGRLDKEQILRLDEHEFVWDIDQAAWNAAVERLKAYKAEHGNTLVPHVYKCADGFCLGKWVSKQRAARAKGKLDKEQILQLDEHGFVWDVHYFAWNAAVARLEAYKAEHGNALVPQVYKCADGFWLGMWVSKQRAARAKGKLDKEQILQLDEHGFVWDVNYFAWNAAVARLEAYKGKHRNTLVPMVYKCADGFRLGRWVGTQRLARAKGRLDKEQILKLDEHEFVWNARGFCQKKNYYTIFGWVAVAV